jgi:hypothetical protein
MIPEYNYEEIAMKQRPFRFGILCEQMNTQQVRVTKACQVEDAGFATLLIRDHFGLMADLTTPNF